MSISVGAVALRVVAPDEKTLMRAVRQLESQTGARFDGLPSHPGRKGDWLAYAKFDVQIPPEEPTRRRPRGATCTLIGGNLA